MNREQRIILVVAALYIFFIIILIFHVLTPSNPQAIEESIMSRFEVTGIFIGECEPINLFNPSCSFRMDIETSDNDKLEPGRSYIFISRDRNMEEVHHGERVWLHCIRHDAERYRCDFRDFQN